MISCHKVNFDNESDCRDLLNLLNVYATDIMGGGESLSTHTQQNLIPELSKRQKMVHAFLATIDSECVGLAICFEGFSTFSCKPLLNIHDLCVSPLHRRKGVCSTMLFYIEQYARAMGCCKLTLEVLEGNHAAKAAYTNAGFQGYELDPNTGCALFWQKQFESH